MDYLWLKALHLIAVVCWFAALFYLPRLFVHHALSLEECEQENNGEAKYLNHRFKEMERKLLRGIAYPSAILTTVLGLALALRNMDYYLGQTWFLLKLLLIVSMFAYHGYCHYFQRQFAMDANQRSHRFYRIFNELPIFSLVFIMILVVVKPF